jgi:hypothetical protein
MYATDYYIGAPSLSPLVAAMLKTGANPLPEGYKPAAPAPTTSTINNPAIAYLENLRTALKQAGFTAPALDFALVLCYFESGGFTNNGARQNNPGNIMWNQNDKYGTKGTYNSINKTFYSNYPTLLAFAQKLRQVLSQAPGRPIDATSSRDFVNRLAANKYWNLKELTADQYYNNLVGVAKRINLLSQIENNQAALDNYAATYKQDQAPNFVQGITDWFNTAPLWQKGAAAAGLFVGLKILLK